MDKKSQRRQLKFALANISDKLEQSESIAEFIKCAELPKGSICIYNSIASEVDTKALIEYFCNVREVYLPVVDGEDIALVNVDKDTKYVEGAWGIYEPIGKRLAPQDVRPSVTVTPLLGVDRRLNRLGKGKGYYDRYFAKTDTFKVGLAFREQVVEKVYADDWDKPLDMLITPDGIIIRS
ncbi:MAG: 5-formyltetrahydrofolate cyclo-ligase [Clostridia bacterium]|jgi:5-formyltetrahydrofolate cyclo-ligase|nr:5-formyltetrahydrofolate cyclo-ligase [Clostridia bacterium]